MQEFIKWKVRSLMVEVVKTGFYDSIQDFGRIGYQEYGVPYSGVMDRYAASLANSLLGNKVDAAVMEITMTGPTLKFHCNAAICVSGANISPSLDENKMEINQVVQIKKNEVLSFGKLLYGFRCYLAVSGGFNTENIMQSFSMYKGITSQFRLNKRDILPISETTVFNVKHASIRVDDSYLNTNIIQVFKGPEFSKLSENQKELLLSKKFTISKNNSRMAYQLAQPFENKIESILTSLVLPGTVQLTPAGKLIILMRDCQTTGGYPRVLQLKETSIDVLAQKFTGQTVQFQLVNYF